MTSLAMIVPTRDRPHNIVRLARECADHDQRDTLCVVVAVDVDQVGDYAGRVDEWFDSVTMPERLQLVPKLNRLAVAYARLGYTHIGFMGDDHVPRTQDWDTALCEAAGPCGMAYGDDLEHGDELPTAIVMSASIVRALDAFCPADVEHLCCDMVWRDLGHAAERLHYVPDVVIEHVHPEMPGTRHRGGAPMDAQYERTRTPEQYERDNRGYNEWRANAMHADVLTIRSIEVDA